MLGYQLKSGSQLSSMGARLKGSCAGGSIFVPDVNNGNLMIDGPIDDLIDRSDNVL